MQMGGMDSIRDQRFQSTFSLVRITMIKEVLMGNLRPLHQAPWCFQPWGSILLDSLHTVLNIIIEIPRYAMLAQEPCDVAAFQSLRRDLDARFEAWHAKEIADKVIPPYCFVPADPNDWLQRAVGHDVRFKTLRHCFATTAYWMGKILLYESWETVHLAHGGAGIEEAFAVACVMADSICLCLRQVLRQDHGIISIQSMSLHISVIAQFVARHGMADRQQRLRRLVLEATSGAFEVPYLKKLL